MKIIEITISPQGETTVATQGFAGSDCREASRLLEQALGQMTGERLTTEFFAETRVLPEQQQQR